jgi:hypothetical protein
MPSSDPEELRLDFFSASIVCGIGIYMASCLSVGEEALPCPIEQLRRLLSWYTSEVLTSPDNVFGTRVNHRNPFQQPPMSESSPTGTGNWAVGDA